MLHETDPAKQRDLMRRFEKYVLDDQAHEIWVLVVVPDRAVPLLRQGLEDRPTHFINQDLARIWLDK